MVLESKVKLSDIMPLTESMSFIVLVKKIPGQYLNLERVSYATGEVHSININKP